MNDPEYGGALTEAQRDFLLFLPPDGEWKRTSSRDLERHGANSLRAFGKSGLVEGYYREVMQHRLTKEGQRVRAALAQNTATNPVEKDEI